MRAIPGCLAGALVAVLAAPLAAAPAGEAPTADERATLQAELVALTETIEEAVRTGDRATVERLAVAEMRLVNRDGRSYSRQELLDDLVPPRPGYDLAFTVLEPELLWQGGSTALLTFLLDERLVIWGVDVSTAYRCNFLFFLREGGWRLALFEYFEKPVDPRVLDVDPTSYDDLAGVYEIAPGRWVTRVRRDGNRLVASRDGGAERELLPFAVDRFFYAGQEGELFFVRGAGGAVEGMVFRRNYKDVRYRRLPAGPG